MCSKEESMKTQARIRQLAEDQNTALKGFSTWEQSIKKRDNELRQTEPKEKSISCSKSNTQTHPQSSNTGDKENYEAIPLSQLKGKGNSILISPSHTTMTKERVVSKVDNMKPHVTNIEKNQSKEEMAKAERNRGNDFFKNAKYKEAIKSYTKCIMMDSNSCTAYSNRAMAYLKLKDWLNAENDSSLALKIDPFHVKSYQRRSLARYWLGKLRASLRDLCLAENCPSFKLSKDFVKEKQKVQKSLIDAVKRAPRRKITIAQDPKTDSPLQKNTLSNKSTTTANKNENQGGFKTEETTETHNNNTEGCANEHTICFDLKIDEEKSHHSWTMPKSWYEFETKWSSLQSKEEKVLFLKFIKPHRLSHFYKNGFENVDILLELVLHASEVTKDKYSFLRSISEIPSLDMLGMMVTTTQKDDFLSKLENVKNLGVSDEQCLNQILNKLGFNR